MLSHLSIAQTTFSFKHLNTCTFTYATFTFITEAFYLVTQVQLLFNKCYSELMPYTELVFFTIAIQQF